MNTPEPRPTGRSEALPMPNDVLLWIHNELIVPDVKAELEAKAASQAKPAA